MPDPGICPVMTACELCGEEIGFGSLATTEELASPRCTACTSPSAGEPPPRRRDVARALAYLRDPVVIRLGPRPRPSWLSRAAYLQALAMPQVVSPMGTRVPMKPDGCEPATSFGCPKSEVPVPASGDGLEGATGEQPEPSSSE
jgi:hypothetical protein